MIFFYKNVIKLALFFSFFISFAIINFQSAAWGLQLSWVLWFIFCSSYIYFAIFRIDKYHFFNHPRFLLIFYLFLLMFTVSILDWCAIGLGIIELQDAEGFRRSLGHTGYLLFYFIIFVCVYHFLKNNEQKYWQYFRWFLIYPFIFIAIWGVYQYLTTYDFMSYLEVFNNNLSTGFTYLRFKDDHRVSSIFPEPSEYSYYLALMSPIVWAYFKKRLPFYDKKLSLIMIYLLASQIIMIKSLSFFVALPFIAVAIVRDVEGKQGGKIFVKILIISLLLIAVVGIGFIGRIGQTASGDDGSVAARYIGLLESIELFQRSPLTGFGYGVTRSLDGLSFLLASFGIIGTIAFIIIIRQFIKKVKNEATPILSGAMVCLIASCISSNNTLDHVFIWVLVAFMASCPRLKVTSFSDPYFRRSHQ